MPYETTCPSCQARLNVRDDTGTTALLCPRCLHEVPHPRAAPATASGAAAPATGISARPARAVPSVEAEVTSTARVSYFVVLGVTLLGIVGTIAAFAHTLRRPGAGGDLIGWLYLLLLFELVLTVLFMIPLSRRWSRTGLRTAGIVALLLLLTPVAFIVVFLSVCAVCAVTISF